MAFKACGLPSVFARADVVIQSGGLLCHGMVVGSSCTASVTNVAVVVLRLWALAVIGFAQSV